MPRTISEIKRIMESEGTPWTPDLRDSALSAGAIDDFAPSNANLAPNLFSALMSVPNAALSGATMGITDKTNPVYDVSTGAPWLDTAINKVITPTARGLGMSLPLMLAPQVAVPKALAEGGALARLAGRALAGAPGFSLYEGGAGAVAGARENGVPGAIEGFNRGATRGATVGAAMGALKVPERLGGAYTGAGLGLGALTAAEGGSLTDIAGSVAAGYGMHAIGTEARTTPRLKAALKSLDRAEAAKAEKTKILNDLLAEQYAEQQANEAALELQSRKFEDMVPAKGEKAKRVEYEKTKAPGSRPELKSEAALELVDAPEDARTQPNEGPKVPLLQGMGPLYRTPLTIPEKVASGEISPEEAATLAPSLAIPGLRRPGSVIDPTARGEAGGPIEVVPGGAGAPVQALLRPGAMPASARAENVPMTAEQLIDATSRTVGTPELGWWPRAEDQGPLGTHNVPPEAVRTPKPGFLRTAEDRIPPDSQDARSETQPPEAPTTGIAAPPSAAAGQGAPAVISEPAPNPKRRPGQKKPKAADGDVTLGTMGGGLEGARKAFLRPGSRKVADPTGEKAEQAFRTPGFFKKPTETLVVHEPAGGYRGAKDSDQFRSAEGRLQGMDRASSEMSSRINEALAKGSGNHGAALAALRDAGFSEKLSYGERRDLGRALRGTTNPAALKGSAASAFRALDAYRRSVVIRARGAGVDLGELPNYFHQGVVNPKNLRKGVVRERVLENMQHSRPNEYRTRADAVKALDEYIEIAANPGMGAKQTQKLAERMFAKGQVGSVEEALGKIARYRKTTNVREFSGFRERASDLPFYDPDPVEAFTKYINGAESRIAEAHAFGPKFEKMDALKGQIGDEKLRSVVSDLVDYIRDPEKFTDQAGRTFFANFRKVTGLKLSPLTTAKNLQQVLAGLLATDMPTFVRGLRAARTTFGEDWGLRSGATVGQTERAMREIEGGLQKYHKATGLIPSERWGRKVMANIGRTWAEKMAKQAIESAPGSKERKFAEHELKVMEISPEEIIRAGKITEDQLLRASYQMADNTYFGYRAKDLPRMFNESQLTKTLLQFKPFGAQQARFLTKMTVDEFRAGNVGRGMRNVALLALVYPMSGEVVNDFVAMLQGKKRTNNLFGRWVEDALSVGVATSFATDLASGAWYGNSAQAFAGPAIGSTLDTAELLLAVARTGHLTDSQARKLVRQIPYAGPLMAYHVVPQAGKASDSGGQKGKTVPGKKVQGKKRPGKKVAPRN